MARFLIVSKAENIREYEKIAKEYNVGYEYNDFYMPDVLDSNHKKQQLQKIYETSYQPDFCTMHGAFLDIIVFSSDEKIREIAKLRMRQSMDMAKEMGAKAVVFHTNVNSFLSAEVYLNEVINKTVEFLKVLLEEYPKIQIYMENMFDDNPYVLFEISKALKQYENYGVCLDYAHASISSTPIKEWVLTLHPYIRHIHINDNDLKNDLHLAVGDGKIDWEQFKIYYNKYFTKCSLLIETTKPEDQIRSMEYLKKIGVRRDENES